MLTSIAMTGRSPSLDFIDAEVPFMDPDVKRILSKRRKKQQQNQHQHQHQHPRSSSNTHTAEKDHDGTAPESRPLNMEMVPSPDSNKPFQTVVSNPSTPAVDNFNIITLNVSGARFQTLSETLERYPTTLLGNAVKRQAHYNAATGEYFFDRHRGSFEAILYFYQSQGRLKRPTYVPLDIFLHELKFFEMDENIMENFWITEGYIKPEEMPLPKNKFQRQIWELMEQPDSSKCARILAFFSVFVIVCSIVSFCLETIPSLKSVCDHQNSTQATTEEPEVTEATVGNGGAGGNNVSTSNEDLDWTCPFFVIEFLCIIWFTLEFTLRFLSCPSKIAFCKSFLNIIDFIAIVPFFINLFLRGGGSAMSFAVLRVLRLVRVFRIFKLSRHSVGLQILGKTFRASIQELCLLIFFLCIALVLFSSAIYFAESGRADSHFTSIPEAFWYSIVTMTTVGYGDKVPKGAWGKIVGGGCAIIGVLVLALPVPVIVANFKHFYQQETRLATMRRYEQNDDCDKFEDCSTSAD